MKTTVVGSYPTPAWLTSRPTRAALRDAVLVCLKTQELAGIDVVSDGELVRFDIDHPETNGMIDFFVRPLGGVATLPTWEEMRAFRDQPGMRFRKRPAAVVRGPLDAGALDLPSAWNDVAGLSDRPMKFTVTSPYMLARTLLDLHYRDVRALTMALADILAVQVASIDAAIVQIDEANLTGHPEDASWAHEPVNRILDAVHGTTAVHLCFGNYGGSTIQRGRWEDLALFLSRLHVDHLVLEFARRGYDELAHLAGLPPALGFGIGVIDIKDTEVETPDIVAARIEKAAGFIGADRIRYVHPDCGFWMLPRSVADAKMRALVRGRDLFRGRRA